MSERFRMTSQPKLIVATLLCITISTGCISGDPNINVKTRLGVAQGHAIRFLREAGFGDLKLYQDYDSTISERTWFEPATGIKHRYTVYDYLKKSERPGPIRFVIVYDAVTRRTYLRDDPRSNVNLAGWEDFRQRALTRQPGDYRDLIEEAGVGMTTSPSKYLGKTQTQKVSKK